MSPIYRARRPAAGFATIPHDSNVIGSYSEEVNVSKDNSYGQGEYIWSPGVTTTRARV